MSGKKLLIIPDYHAHPDYDNKRAGWVGNLIAGTRPDLVVCLGDFADLPSLNATARKHSGYLRLEGSRIKRDLDSAKDAFDKLNKPFSSIRRYNPRLVMLLGNHENFIDRTASHDPKIEGFLTLDNLPYAKSKWRVVPFLTTYAYAGWAFSHFFASGVMGRPIGGKHVAASLVAKNHMSSVVGHNHLLDYHEETRPDGKKVIGISAGCLTHPDHVEDWNHQTAASWWRGVIMLDGVKCGGATGVSMITLDELRGKWS